MRLTYNDSPYESFEANVPADLVGKEGLAVEQVAGTNKIQLFTGNAPLLGWLQQRLEGDTAWTVRLAGKGGTVRAVCGAGGLAQAPAYVKAAAGGQMVTAASGEKAHGVKIRDYAASAQGDVIEVIDGFQIVP